MLYFSHMQSLLILGRQPALGLAELESLYGAEALRPAGATAALLDIDTDKINFDRLGGSTRLAKVLTVLDTTDWRDIEKFLVSSTPEHAALLPEGKLTIGLSAYGIKVSPAAVNATGLSVKKSIRKSGKSARLVPNKSLELNTAQVLHNNLTGSNGWELLLVRDDRRTILAQTVQVQDIESYTIRDRERPRRDARVGMLPPKLAQIIINLATNYIHETDRTDVIYLDRPTVLLDPFCGTGVVLTEAKLQGFGVYGTDIEQRMVEYSHANLEWLAEHFTTSDAPVKLEVGDATSHHWNPEPDVIACETYLGRPFTTPPVPEVLAQTISECNLIIKKFLKNVGSQVKPGFTLCLAVPAWQTRPGQFKHLPLLDSLEELRYNRISFEHVRNRDLLYYREDQVVARELLVLVKK